MKTNKRRKRKKTSAPRLREYVSLLLVPSLGARRCKLLMEKFGSARAVFRAPASELKKVESIGEATARQILTFNRLEEADRILEKTARYGARIVSWEDDDYPALLPHIYDPPLLLWVLGDSGALRLPGIAVIGTRRAGRYGLAQAERLSGELARSGLAVVSGLAYGIDAAAHRAALKAGGTTIAVLGSGIDIIYPPAHRGLASEIVRSGGAVISEFPLGTRPDAGNFPVRNRVVSGMTLGTLVVESGEKGGSMITATSALDQCREVFALPHAAGTGHGEGGNGLIRRGLAKLVTNLGHILEELPLRAEPPVPDTGGREPRWKTMELDELSRRICGLLGEGPRHVDELAAELEIPVPRLLGRLLELEMNKCVRQRKGRLFELA